MGVTAESAVTPTVIVGLSLISSASCAALIVIVGGKRKAMSGKLSLLLRQRIRIKWHKSVAYRECSE